MTLFLVLLFVIGPIAEIYVLLSAGGAFGVLPVIAACLGTAVVGGVLLRLQGLAALHDAQRKLASGETPVDALADGVFLVLAAPLLMTPGFLTDAIGFAFLTPVVRHWLARQVIRRFKSRTFVASEKITIYPPRS